MISLLDGEAGAIQKYWNRMSGSVLDLGGGQQPLPTATTIVDFVARPKTSVEFILGDLCDGDFYISLSNRVFDWVYCNHVLEDLYDPFVALKNIPKIARCGLIGIPHWTREVTVQSNRDDWEHICGWPHHFWLVGINRGDGALEFFPKQCWLVYGERPYVTANINLEWDGGELPYRNIYHDYHGKMMRNDLIAWLEDRWRTE